MRKLRPKKKRDLSKILWLGSNLGLDPNSLVSSLRRDV